MVNISTRESLPAARRVKPAAAPFGLRFDPLSVREAARHIASAETRLGNVARVFVTPNIQHINCMRHDAELRSAIEDADLLTCDGFPVAKYAAFRGCDVAGRVTGREVVDQLMHATPDLARHRLYFLIDSDETAEAIRDWAHERNLTAMTAIEVAPMGFGSDAAYCEALAQRARDHGTTLLFMGVGAPRSEKFAGRFRYMLPNCWILCIGQSVRIALGINRTPPALVETLGIEWLWRIVLEPRRLFKRYVSSTIGFTAAVFADLVQSPTIH